jgi:hypothetical protein
VMYSVLKLGTDRNPSNGIKGSPLRRSGIEKERRLESCENQTHDRL